MEDKKQVSVAFLALDPYIERNIPSPKETVIAGKDLVQWGDLNRYPEFLWELYGTVPSLRSIINGTADFITGDSQTFQLPGYEPGIVNTRGGTVRSVVEALAIDYETFGAFAIQVIRDLSGEVAEVYHCPVRYLRSNKENTVFYYSEKWGIAGRHKPARYPAFMPIPPERWAQLTDEEKDGNASSILFVKNTITQTYPSPIYAAAVNDCETERQVSMYHLNAVNNNFEPSCIINFNNGTPDDETRQEIEKDVEEKFSGAANARRIMLSFNPDKENATTFEYPKTEAFGSRYTALSKHIRQQIFTAFRANPNLFGIPTESLGFSQEEYEAAFRLYNRTMVRPVQRKICDAFDRIFGGTGVLTITPFSLEEGQEKKVS